MRGELLIAGYVALALVCFAEAFGEYDLQTFDNSLYPEVYGEPTGEVSKRRYWVRQGQLYRNIRGRKKLKCGRVRFCFGICCGGRQCCKKGWGCRYISHTRTHTCIP